MQYPFQFIRLILSGNNTPIYKKEHQTKPKTAESEDFMNDNFNSCGCNNNAGFLGLGGNNSEILFFLGVFLLLFTSF